MKGVSLIELCLETCIRDTPNLVKKDVLMMIEKEARLEYELDRMQVEMRQLTKEFAAVLAENNRLKGTIPA